MEPGHRIRARAASNIYWIEGGPDDARSRIGIHPTGGKEPDASVIWSAWDRQPEDKTEGWRDLQVDAEAMAPVVTLFLDFEQRNSSSPGGQWRINAFDSAAIEDLDASVAFERGDCQGDRSVDITDAVFLLAHLFQGGQEPGCSRPAT